MGKPWKELEKRTAEALGGKRINRASDYSVSDVDVVLEDFENLKIDAKFRARHAHHSLVEEIRNKYCGENDRPVLVTKGKYEKRRYVTVDLDLFSSLLDQIRKLRHNKNDGADGRTETRDKEKV